MKNLLLAALVSALCLCTAMTAKADTAANINIEDSNGNTGISSMYYLPSSIDDRFTLYISFSSINIAYSDNVYWTTITTIYDNALLSLVDHSNNYDGDSISDIGGTIIQTAEADITGDMSSWDFMDLSTLVFTLEFEVIDISALETEITIATGDGDIEIISAPYDYSSQIFTTTGFEGSRYVIGELLEEQQEEPSDVPEPGTLALALLGLGAVSFVRRKSI